MRTRFYYDASTFGRFCDRRVVESVLVDLGLLRCQCEESIWYTQYPGTRDGRGPDLGVSLQGGGGPFCWGLDSSFMR